MKMPMSLLVLLTLLTPLAFAAPCSDQVYDELLQPATAKKRAIHVKCDLTLEASNIITKRILLVGKQSSDVSINCNGATLEGGVNSLNNGKDMIELRSQHRKNGTWSVPSNIQIKNCQINGSVRVYGMGRNGEAKAVKQSSLTKNHVNNLRQNAPSAIRFDNIKLNGTGRVPFYLGPGTHDVSLTHSTIQGNSVSVAIYLDAESTKNNITNNQIRVKTTRREQIAIDGSSHNTISNNYFGNLSNGGIYLYRNCGEGGTIRHSSPTYNLIQNNSFYYKNYNPRWSWLFGKEPAIYLGSRNGNRNYCDEDKGQDFGSSQSDMDFAQYNIIAQNKVFGLDPGMMFVESAKTDTPNYFFDNKKVSTQITEPNGCILMDKDTPSYLASGKKSNGKVCKDGSFQ